MAPSSWTLSTQDPTLEPSDRQDINRARIHLRVLTVSGISNGSSTHILHPSSLDTGTTAIPLQVTRLYQPPLSLSLSLSLSPYLRTNGNRF